MNPTYRIYFDDRPFLIVPRSVNPPINGALTIQYQNKQDLKKTIEELDENRTKAIIIEADDTAEAFQDFKKRFVFIQAGGGLVKNEKDEYLFIFRRGKWDLPKGKLDAGETIRACALREVKEETGLVNVILKHHLVDTWHVYHERGKFILKESVWFNMDCSGKQKLIPQTEEDIYDIKWLKKEDWPKVYDNVFPSIKDVLKAAGRFSNP